MSSRILLIPRIKIHNANAISSPYTIGFPAITAWLGAVHALERKLKECTIPSIEFFVNEFENVRFNRTAVVCHDIKLHTYRGRRGFVSSIVGTGNPLTKDGKRPSFIEEARCDLTVSLLIEYQVYDDDNLPYAVEKLLNGHMKMAGGDILGFGKPECLSVENEGELKRLMGRVMPGHCLIERRDLMLSSMNAGCDAIDALLDHLKVTYRCETNDGKAEWSRGARKEKGWIVPIATGFQAISELAIAEQQRDEDTPHCFAESIVTLGEFIMPYRIDNLDQIMWYYHYDSQNNLYMCQQSNNQPMTKEATNG